MNNKIKGEAKAPLWDSFYENNIIPWQSKGLHNITARYLKKYSRGSKVLEIGCGTGEEAGKFIDLGFIYRGFDLSKKAIRIAKNNNPGHTGVFFVGDFLNLPKTQKYSVIYDKGVFHNLAGVKRREQFVEQVASTLKAEGIWITVCGSVDFYNPKQPHGAIFLQHLIVPAESYFEVLEVVKAPYGTKKASFDGWYCVFRRR